MPEYSGLKIGPFGNILVCPLIETHGYTNVIHRVLENNQSRNFTYINYSCIKREERRYYSILYE